MSTDFFFARITRQLTRRLLVLFGLSVAAIIVAIYLVVALARSVWRTPSRIRRCSEPAY